MKEDEFYKEFENEDTEWEGDNCYQGLLIISKYTKDVVKGAGHDQVWSESVSTLVENGITIEDARALRLLNWGIEYESLFCFV